MNGFSAPGPVSGAPPEGVKRRKPLSRARIERIADRTVSAFSLVFGLQILPTALGQLGDLREPCAFVVLIIVFGGLALTVLFAIVQRFVKTAMGVLAIVYLVAIVTWPLLVNDPAPFARDRPWVWFLCSVLTAFAAVAWPLWLATVYTFAAPVVYGFVRALPAGGGASAELAGIDAVYAIILGGVILAIVTMMREASTAVDVAQGHALTKYSNAVRQHATEVERVQVDAIVHDSVLTTLLSAASARTPEAKELAARMAADAIGHLHAAEASGPQDQPPVGLDVLHERLLAAAESSASHFVVEARDTARRTLPVAVAEAVSSAAVQAMVNSNQHAGGPEVRRSVTIVGGAGGATVQVVVEDSGRGFVSAEVPAERLGLRVSIQERLAKVGGRATVRSAPGRGTSVTIVWPSPEPASPPDRERETVR
ncbi:two-component system sensor protein [Leifsonia xyli subsp. xyli]|uniref:Two-component system, sensor protein n=2 Tax=Leifsonia xyli subsp. xyli TaxID=59736 RepID=Q6AGN2_LEIXX|nr:ATP-binding protein [Leifsonia xyli]AAT88463.1 two-component system, sensor protein [Leifsonia xyli subsp. xyli str. CTCB07]ODA91011.1 two-component system sensor protein [Leifsonia xyli subsp. xyli]